jgi:hypothetical protein
MIGQKLDLDQQQQNDHQTAPGDRLQNQPQAAFPYVPWPGEKTRTIRGAADGTGAERREPDIADRPDSRAMAAIRGLASATTRAVDAKHKMIVEQAVTNQVVDIGLLTQTAEPARARFRNCRQPGRGLLMSA